MKWSSEGKNLFDRLISEMLEDGFVKISDHTFYKKVGNITVTITDNVLNVAHQGKLYGILHEKDLLRLANGFEPILSQVKYLLAFWMRQDMNRVMNFLSQYFLN